MSQELVLVVDDDPDQRAIACALLRYAGYQVEEARDVATAEIMIEKKCPHLILLDLSMPGKTGIDWLHDLTQRNCVPAARVVAYTSFGDVYDSELKALGVRAVIDKGATPRQFLDMISSVLETPLPDASASSPDTEMSR